MYIYIYIDSQSNSIRSHGVQREVVQGLVRTTVGKPLWGGTETLTTSYGIIRNIFGAAEILAIDAAPSFARHRLLLRDHAHDDIRFLLFRGSLFQMTSVLIFLRTQPPVPQLRRGQCIVCTVYLAQKVSTDAVNHSFFNVSPVTITPMCRMASNSTENFVVQRRRKAL